MKQESDGIIRIPRKIIVFSYIRDFKGPKKVAEKYYKIINELTKLSLDSKDLNMGRIMQDYSEQFYAYLIIRYLHDRNYIYIHTPRSYMTIVENIIARMGDFIILKDKIENFPVINKKTGQEITVIRYVIEKAATLQK
ncbi:MAG: hypothetical protein AABY22_14270 [Nanoarchaeota archaeon]